MLEERWDSLLISANKQSRIRSHYPDRIHNSPGVRMGVRVSIIQIEGPKSSLKKNRLLIGRKEALAARDNDI